MELFAESDADFVLSCAMDFPMATLITTIQIVFRNRRGMVSVKSHHRRLNKPKAVRLPETSFGSESDYVLALRRCFRAAACFFTSFRWCLTAR